MSAWDWLTSFGGRERFLPIRSASIGKTSGVLYVDARHAVLLDQLSDLEALELVHCRLSPEARARVSRWRGLKTLHAVESTFGDDDLASFARCEGLVSLHVNGGQLSPQGIALLAEFPNLTDLHLGMTPLTEGHFAQLRHAPTLRRLDLSNGMLFRRGSNSPLDDQALLALPELPELEELDLKWNRALCGPGLACVRNLPNLRWLNLDECPIEDEGLGHLEQSPRLGQLILDASRITPEAVDRLLEAHPGMGFIDTSGKH